jgi:hypothetical protein
MPYRGARGRGRGEGKPLDELLRETDTLALVVVHDL